jgi:hypothetical protein
MRSLSMRASYVPIIDELSTSKPAPMQIAINRLIPASAAVPAAAEKQK